MKKSKTIEVEFQLPEAIIQHIQSFLTVKQAAQTSILSKSWFNAWLTRPNLYFDQRDFGSNTYNRFDEEGFWEYAKKMMQRYEESKLKIESFRLSMRGKFMDNADHYGYSIAKQLIVKAMKMGATDLNFELLYRNSSFAFPHEVFGYETLIRLSVIGCKIDLGADGNVCCSRLKSLILCRMIIEGDIIRDIILSCPLIEKFCLSESWSSSDCKSSNIDGPINLCEFHKLKCLLLGGVKISTSFFHDFESKFPCLKDLTLHRCFGYHYKGIKISSRSLECISFEQEERVLRADFDVPSIRKFKFEGSRLPSLAFRTASMEWESDISIRCYHPSTLWFLELKKLLTNLCLSKISLSLHIGSIVEKSVDFQGSPQAVVENLTMHAPSAICSSLLKCMFLSCRPKFITQYLVPKSCAGGVVDIDFVMTLCKRLIQINQNSCTRNQSMFGLCGFEAVDVEIFRESLAEWQLVTWKTLSDASASLKDKRKIRFQLRWREEPSAFK